MDDNERSLVETTKHAQGKYGGFSFGGQHPDGVTVCNPLPTGITGTGIYWNAWDHLEVKNKIPEPASLAVWSLLAGLGLVFGWRRSRR